MVYSDPQWQDTERAVRGVRDWFSAWRGPEIRGHWIAAVLLAIGSIVATALVWFGVTWLLMMLMGPLGRRAASREVGLDGVVLGAALAASAIIVGAFLAAAWHWRRRMTRISLHGGALEIADDRESPSMLIPTADNQSADAFDWLMFPATLAGMAIGHLMAARRERRADPDIVARCLVILARAGRRVLLHDMERQVADARFPDALRAMRHMNGVLWWTRDQVALSLNDDLAAQVSRHGAWRSH